MVSPSKREREYARRRYEEWQQRQAVKRAKQQRMRRNGMIGISALLGVGVLAGVASLVFDGSDEPSPTAAPTQSPPATQAADSPCRPISTETVDDRKNWDSPPSKADAKNRTWTVALVTNCGRIELSLDGANAPQAVSSTLRLVKGGFYQATPCHRLTTEGIFVLQCGDPTGSGSGGPGYTYGPIENAPENDVYPKGTVAMARVGGDASSMGSQFFLVYSDSTIPSDASGGYTVMGKITKGLDLVEKIASGGVAEGGGDGKPRWPVSIESASVLDG